MVSNGAQSEMEQIFCIDNRNGIVVSLRDRTFLTEANVAPLNFVKQNQTQDAPAPNAWI
jgi:hypothetical protein